MSRSFSRRQLARRAVGLGTAIAAGSLVAESVADPTAAAGTTGYVPLPTTAPTDGQLYGYSSTLGSTAAFNPTGAQILARTVNQSGKPTTCPPATVTAIPGTTIVVPASPNRPVELTAAVTISAHSAAGGFLSLEIHEASNGIDAPVKFKVFTYVPPAKNAYLSVALPADLGYLGQTARSRTFSLFVNPVAVSVSVLNSCVSPTQSVITARTS